ncbi:hypothetical protein [Rouxiella badensis]|jgi:hypothetical protein|uniref:hypothetical protein n=1 Tax=Rouxiella badensis TaxID=1646377 RepID=UPI0017885E90|nr:hypothetical protein [Rouxiella badensis]QOI58027.1 hypothetical protein H2866_22785 [Rouxiella badensis subsp. acadiensis]
MANTKFFTQDQIDNAKLSLADLPDLTPNRITREAMLTSLSDDIVTLSTHKGYSAADIKKALEGLDIQVSEKAIAEILKKSTGKTTRSRKPSRSSANGNAATQPSQETRAI